MKLLTRKRIRDLIQHKNQINVCDDGWMKAGLSLTGTELRDGVYPTHVEVDLSFSMEFKTRYVPSEIGDYDRAVDGVAMYMQRQLYAGIHSELVELSYLLDGNIPREKAKAMVDRLIIELER